MIEKFFFFNFQLTRIFISILIFCQTEVILRIFKFMNYIFRFIFIASAIHYLVDFRSSDRFYTPLPLYHTAGGIMSIGQSLLHGGTTVIRKKFSASAYFSDCVKYKCTVRIFF